MHSWMERTHCEVVAGRLGWAMQQLADHTRHWLMEWMVPQSHADKLGGIVGGAKETAQPRAPAWGK